MSHSAEAICVDPEQVNELWPYVKDQLREAAKRGLSSFDDIEAAVMCGESLLWIVVDEASIKAAAVTELIEKNGIRECCIALCGGREMDRWIDAYTDIEKFARDERCVRIRIIGRRGWERALVGYRQTCVVLEKELT